MASQITQCKNMILQRPYMISSLSSLSPSPTPSHPATYLTWSPTSPSFTYSIAGTMASTNRLGILALLGFVVTVTLPKNTFTTRYPYVLSPPFLWVSTQMSLYQRSSLTTLQNDRNLSPLHVSTFYFSSTMLYL